MTEPETFAVRLRANALGRRRGEVVLVRNSRRIQSLLASGVVEIAEAPEIDPDEVDVDAPGEPLYAPESVAGGSDAPSDDEDAQEPGDDDLGGSEEE